MSLVTETLGIRTHTGLQGRIGMNLIGPLDAHRATVLMDETQGEVPDRAATASDNGATPPDVNT